jgi:hypothetical protein
MKTIELSCTNCGKLFNRLLKAYKSDTKRGRKNFYCSLECVRPDKDKLIKCANCGNEFHCSPGKIRKSKSGNNFCSRKCHVINNNQYRKGKLHPRYTDGSGSYRSKKDITECESCGDKRYWLLIVHHKDSNRSHNDDDNLMVLCYNCHAEQHIVITDGLLCVNWKAQTTEEIKGILLSERKI